MRDFLHIIFFIHFCWSFNLLVLSSGQQIKGVVFTCEFFTILKKKNSDTHIVQILTIKDCKGPQTNMPKNVGSDQQK